MVCLLSCLSAYGVKVGVNVFVGVPVKRRGVKAQGWSRGERNVVV